MDSSCIILCGLPQSLKRKDYMGNKNYFEAKCDYFNRWLLIICRNLRPPKTHHGFHIEILYELSVNKIYCNHLSWERKSLLICRICILENASGIFPAQQCKATLTDVSWCCCDTRTLKTLNECTLLNIARIHQVIYIQIQFRWLSKWRLRENSSKHTPRGATTPSPMRGMETSSLEFFSEHFLHVWFGGGKWMNKELLLKWHR